MSECFYPQMAKNPLCVRETLGRVYMDVNPHFALVISNIPLEHVSDPSRVTPSLISFSTLDVSR